MHQACPPTMNGRDFRRLTTPRPLIIDSKKSPGSRAEAGLPIDILVPGQARRPHVRCDLVCVRRVHRASALSTCRLQPRKLLSCSSCWVRVLNYIYCFVLLSVESWPVTGVVKERTSPWTATGNSLIFLVFRGTRLSRTLLGNKRANEIILAKLIKIKATNDDQHCRTV
jgi:hypothetical protein